MTALRTRLVAAGLGAGLVLAAPAAAWAEPGRPDKVKPGTTATTKPGIKATTAPTKTTPSAPAGQDLDSLRKRCLAAIDVRLPALSRAKAALVAAKHVTAKNRDALTALVDDATTTLQSVRDEIAADTEANALRKHCRSIFQGKRVFALVLPRTRLVVASDVAGALADKLDDVAGKLDAAIAKAEAAGQDVTQARADLEAMKAKIASGRASATSVPGAVLGLTPAGWNADHGLLLPAGQSLQSARGDLRDARQLAGKIRDELKKSKP